jgi:hypothetical protein
LGTVAPRRLIGASLLALLSGCQLVFGDFTLDTGGGRGNLAFGDACAPDSFRCLGKELQKCADDRASFVTIQTCADADHCDPTAAACRTCTPNQWACNGAQLESCDPSSRWVAMGAPCPSPALCLLAGDRGSGTCGATRCSPAGAYSCMGNGLVRCPPELDAPKLVERCGSPLLCDATKANAQAAAGRRGTCVPPACLEGTYRCDGATLERCRDDETDWDPVMTCDEAASCNPLSGDCSACSDGDAACAGNELWRCRPSGFALAETCATPELCNAALARCDEPECSSPGETRCNAQELQLEECGNDLRWAVREACVTAALCSASAAACLPPACAQNAVRCLGQQHQKCSNDLTHWVDDERCPDGQACDPDGCHPKCTATAGVNAYRCDGAMLERCTEDGSWEPQNRCATHELCDPTNHVCLAPTCADGDYRCFGDQNLKHCGAGRDQWEDFRTCPTGTFCDANPAVGTGQPTCDACRALKYDCETDASGSDELHFCNADGTDAPLVARCPGGCSVSADNVPTCVQMP